MNKRIWILPALILMVVAQLAVPASMIVAHEQTLRNGQVFKFRTQPVDPVDAFRGRYVWLSLEPNVVQMQDINQWGYDRKVFAVLGTDTNGFAQVTRLSLTRPTDEPAVPVRILWANAEKGEVRIDWTGLDRFYMAEGQAPAAEAAYRAHSLRTNQACHVTVRIRGPHTVIEDLFIEDQPIRDWLRAHKGS